MGLENILHGFKRNFRRKLITASFLGSMIACSGGTTNPNPNPPPPHPPNPPPVQPQNRTPVFISSPKTQVDEQRSHNDQCQATDADGDGLSYSFVQAPSWLSIN